MRNSSPKVLPAMPDIVAAGMAGFIARPPVPGAGGPQRWTDLRAAVNGTGYRPGSAGAGQAGLGAGVAAARQLVEPAQAGGPGTAIDLPRPGTQLNLHRPG